MTITAGRRGGRLAGTDPTADALRSFLHTDLSGVVPRDQPESRWRARPLPKRTSPVAKL